jgi:hypothetical protein
MPTRRNATNFKSAAAGCEARTGVGGDHGVWLIEFILRLRLLLASRKPF